MAKKTVREYLEERDSEALLSAREADGITRPITAFARGHMSITQSLLARWSDTSEGKERTEAVRIWYEQIAPRIELECDRWFNKDRAPILRGEFVVATLAEAVAQFLGEDANSKSPEATLQRERLSARAVEIADVLVGEIDETLVDTDLRNRVAGTGIRILWGQHGAHFPNFVSTPDRRSSS